MKFSVNQQDLQKSLSYCQGVIEKRSTLPILSNVLLDASESKLTIIATDLDLIFIHQILKEWLIFIFNYLKHKSFISLLTKITKCMVRLLKLETIH